MAAARSAGATVGRLRAALSPHGDLLPLALIVAVGAAIRFATLGHQSFDSGETVTAARILHPSYLATFDAYSTIERSGPLYYTLAWAWSLLLGTSEVALRSLSAIFGTATIVVVFACARRVFSRRAALIAAALAAASPDLLWYSQEARSYPVFIFLGAAGLYFFIRAVDRPSRGSYAGWATCSALALCTHYFSVFAVVPEALWLIWANRRRPRAPLVATAAVGAVGLALLPLAIHQEGTGRNDAFTAIPVLERAASSLVKFMTGEGPTTTGTWGTMPLAFRVAGIAALALTAVALAFLVWRGSRAERRGAAVIGAIGAIAFCVPVAAALAGLDYVEPRNLLGSLVPLLVVTAAGIDVAIRSLARRPAPARLAPALAPVLLSAAVIAATALRPSLQRYDWRAIGSLVAATPDPGVILAEPASAAKPLHYFLGRPLAPLTATRFPCGVRSRTIVTIDRHRAPLRHSRGFSLSSSRRAPRGWVVSTYRTRSPTTLDPADLRGLELAGPSAAARVDRARPVPPRLAPRLRLADRPGGPPILERLADWGTGGVATRLPGATPLARPAVRPRGWPLRSCPASAPARTRPLGRLRAALGRFRALGGGRRPGAGRHARAAA